MTDGGYGSNGGPYSSPASIMVLRRDCTKVILVYESERIVSLAADAQSLLAA